MLYPDSVPCQVVVPFVIVTMLPECVIVTSPSLPYQCPERLKPDDAGGDGGVTGGG